MILIHHLKELAASGISRDTAEANGVYSETSPTKVAELLHRKSDRFIKKNVPCIVYPFIGPDGANGYYRVKWDRPPKDKKGGVQKYSSPTGRPNEIYLPAATRPLLESPDVPLVITEGEKKALCADQNGFPCIGLTGVHAWKQKDVEDLLPSLNRLKWEGRKIYIAFDSDSAENPNVADGLARLAMLLQNRGAVVKVARLPTGPAAEDGKPQKVGLDDFIVANGAPALHKLLAEATDPEPPDPALVKSPVADLDPADEVKAYLATGELDGVSRLRFWRGAFWLFGGGRYRELQTSEVRAHLVTHLNESYFKLTTGAVNNCIDQLKAQSLLSSRVDAPAWIAEPPQEWQPGEVLVCRNGLVHLPSYFASKTHLQKPTPRFFSTSALEFAFDPSAPTPTAWQGFLADVWGDDADSIDALREWFGYCLTPDTSQHKILLLVGPPRSGKGTIGRILRALVGPQSVAGPTLGSLGTRFGLWPLLGKTLAIISDARLGGRNDVAEIVGNLLSVSGEDAVTIDRKNLEAVTCHLSTRFVVMTNELPRLADASGALANRMVILQMRKSWLGSEDHGLFDRLVAELPGILLWAITGWRRLRERGRFIEPASVKAMRKELGDLTSPVGAFISECCKLEGEIMRETLYKAFKAWREAAGAKHVEDEAGFGRALRAAVPTLGDGWERFLGKAKRTYVGIRLKDDADYEAEAQQVVTSAPLMRNN